MIIFGSFVDNTFDNESDVDIIFIGMLSDKVKDVFSVFPRKVNFQKVTWKEFASIQNHLWHEIKKKHLIYGNVSKVVTIFKNTQ